MVGFMQPLQRYFMQEEFTLHLKVLEDIINTFFRYTKMRLNIRLKIRLFVSVCLIQLTVGAQDIQQTLNKAAAWSAAQPEEAAKLYLRILFFSEQDSIDLVAHTQLAQLYKSIKQFDQAAWHYHQAAWLGKSDSLDLEAAWCYLYQKQAKEGLKILEKVDSSNVNSNEYTLLNGLCYEWLNQDSAALYWYEQYYSHLPSNKIHSLRELDKKLRHFSYRNAASAAILSAIVPGLGQTYTGNFKDGVNSFLLNGTLVAGMIYTSVNYTWIDGVMAFSPWLFRYYLGGITNAKQHTLKSNERRKKQLFYARLKLVPEN